MKTIGIEGPVLAGKSTVIELISGRFTMRNIESCSAPDFVEAALRLGLTLPDLTPSDVCAQVAAARFYLSIDELRRQSSSANLVLLDRTYWTVLAHTFSISELGYVNANVEVQQMVERTVKRLDHLIYLDVSHAEQIRRAQRRSGVPEILLTEAFNTNFNKFFKNNRSEHQAQWIDADRPINEVADEIECYLNKLLG